MSGNVEGEDREIHVLIIFNIRNFWKCFGSTDLSTFFVKLKYLSSLTGHEWEKKDLMKLSYHLEMKKRF